MKKKGNQINNYWSTLQKVALDFDYEVTDERDIDVQVNYRCFFAPGMALYPMEVTGSIYNGCKLSEFKKDGLDNYLKDYQRVEIVDVFIDQRVIMEATK